MVQLRHYLFLLLLIHSAVPLRAQDTLRQYLQRGWAQLTNDNDVAAFNTFAEVLDMARAANDRPATAEALLYMGMCSYGSSYSNGMKYARASMAVYSSLESSQPAGAALGRSRCLQLISTIYSRQGKYRDAADLSREAMAGLPARADTTGTLGLIYNSLGTAQDRLGQPDSAAYYYRLSLEEHMRTGNVTYLPLAYLKMGNVVLAKGDKAGSRRYFDLALRLADSTGNKQSVVSSLLALSAWYRKAGHNTAEAEHCLDKARPLAAALSDKTFYSSLLQEYITLKKEAGDYKAALNYQEELLQLKDHYYDLDKEHIVKSLETEFRVSEKDRQLALVVKEKQVMQLRSYLLWGGMLLLFTIASVIILLLRRINKRNHQLLEVRERIRQSEKEQQRMKEQQMKNDMEHKEAQLSAMALQMYQKSELMKALKEKLEEVSASAAPVAEVGKILNRGLNQEQEWTDFDTRFESINRNFYTLLKQHFPGISPNDLKICALIKLNLSIKEMAGILNISPDSVKTARYRLRKKLQLNTEDNLTDFIMNLQ